MKKGIIILAFAFLILASLINVQAEITMVTSTELDIADSLVKSMGYYYFEDTSLTGIGRNKDIPITIAYQVYELPFNFSGVYPVQVDWCNLTTLHGINEYDSEGNIINTTTEKYNLFFQNQPLNFSELIYKLRSRDYLLVRMNCHYTDVNYLYVENILVGQFDVFLPSYECKGCEEYTLEELSNQIEKNEEITLNELTIYENIQKAVDWNFTIWLIISWIIKIGFIIIAVGLIFVSVYYFYQFLQDIARNV
jgi:hypothetical protein